MSKLPGKLFVDTATGEMLMLPTEIGKYKVNLVAVDGRGAVTVVVDDFAFSVVAVPAAPTCEDGYALIEGRCEYFDIQINQTKRKVKADVEYTDPAARENPLYAINVPYRVAPFEVLDSSVQSDPVNPG